MDSAVVKVKLPAGEPFVAAIVEAAGKYAARRNLPVGAERTFVDMVERSARAINTSGSTEIAFTATESASAVRAELQGVGASGPMTGSSTEPIVALGASCASCSVDANQASVRFELPLG